MRSIDSIETDAYGTRKNLICKKEKIKCNNIIIQKCLILIILQKKTYKDIIQIWQTFLTIRIEY